MLTSFVFPTKQVKSKKKLGSKGAIAQDLTVAFTGFSLDTSHLLNLTSGIESGCQLPE